MRRSNVRIQQFAGIPTEPGVSSTWKGLEMQTGSVKWFDDAKGYGFIATEDGKEIFVHHTGINATGRRTLHEGQQVEFDVGEGPTGRPQAMNVTVI